MSENEGGDSRFVSGLLVGFVVGVLGATIVISMIITRRANSTDSTTPPPAAE